MRVNTVAQRTGDARTPMGRRGRCEISVLPRLETSPGENEPTVTTSKSSANDRQSLQSFDHQRGTTPDPPASGVIVKAPTSMEGFCTVKMLSMVFVVANESPISCVEPVDLPTIV